jgi:Cft2 family RNA processing exonuclease
MARIDVEGKRSGSRATPATHMTQSSDQDIRRIRAGASGNRVARQLSAHADYVEILEWLGNFKRAPQTTFITHGEPAGADALRMHIGEKLDWTC